MTLDVIINNAVKMFWLSSIMTPPLGILMMMMMMIYFWMLFISAKVNVKKIHG